MGASEPILQFVSQSSALLEAAYNSGKIAVVRVIPGSASTLIEPGDDGVGHGTFKSENP
jgi:hypothetical protein